MFEVGDDGGKLDADIFNEWFDIQLSTVITDLEHEPIAREEFQPINLN